MVSKSQHNQADRPILSCIKKAVDKKCFLAAEDGDSYDREIGKGKVWKKFYKLIFLRKNNGAKIATPPY
jgi:hypothetical protein